MDDDVGARQAAAVPMDQSSSSMVSPEHITPADISTPASSSRLSTAPFEFSSAPSDDAMPSFDPTIAAFTDMSFTRPAMPPTAGLRDKSSFPPPPPRQPDCFRRELASHDKKRIKVDPETPALDSIDYWIRFDDDVDKMGSFEIDYSKRNDPPGQNGVGAAAMPGLGSGLYSTAMAPFRAEDFIDDTVFDEQVLSDDEDMLDTAQLGDQPLETENQHLASIAAQAPAPPPPLPPSPTQKGVPGPESLAWASRAQPGPRLNPTMEESARQMRRDFWGTLPRGTSQVLSPEEQRRLLQIALNSGQMPGSFIPPNGFGIGFGAGLGVRPPAEFERRTVGSLSTGADAGQQSMSCGSPPRADEIRDQAGQKQQFVKRPAAARAGSSKKPSGGTASEATKPRSADRIAHNDVERKYRTNLKVKIAELRDAVPALQSPPPGTDVEGGANAQGGPKVSKGTVLTKATEYIQQLEQRNKAITQEHQQLARRLQAFETLFNSVSRQQDLMPNHSMTLFDPRGFC